MVSRTLVLSGIVISIMSSKTERLGSLINSTGKASCHRTVMLQHMRSAFEKHFERRCAVQFHLHVSQSECRIPMLVLTPGTKLNRRTLLERHNSKCVAREAEDTKRTLDPLDVIAVKMVEVTWWDRPDAWCPISSDTTG